MMLENTMSENKKEKSGWPAIILLFIGLPVAFTYGGLWIGLLVLFIGVVTLGWSKRHEGPF
jgi:amino acid permease